MPQRAGVRRVRFCCTGWVLALALAGQAAWAQGRAPESGEGMVRDDPAARMEFELLRLRDPATGRVPHGIRQQELAFSRSIPDRAGAARRPKDRLAAGVASTWNPRGPYNVGGRTRALAIDAADPNVILAGGVSGGMWRSTNGGTGWSKVTGVEDLQSVTCLNQDRRPGHRSVWYYGTGEYSGNSASFSGDHLDAYRGDGIFRSTDSGLTWTQLPSTLSGTPQSFDKVFDYVWNIVTDPSNPAEDEVYAATYGGIRRSTDGGASWSSVLGTGLTATSASTFTDIAVTSSGVLYAALSQANVSGTSAPNRGIYRSTDGITWTNILPAGFPNAYRRVVLAVAPSNETLVYALLEAPLSGGLRHKLYRYAYLSGDGSGTGGAWTDRTANLPAYGGLVGDFDSQGSYDLVIAVKPDNEDAVFVGGVNLYRSTDGFTSTSSTSWIGGYSILNNFALYPNHHHDQHAIAFHPSNPGVMYTANDGGVQKTTNCLGSTVVWTWLNNGYTTSQFYSIALDRGTPGNSVLVGGMQDNGTWWTGSSSPTTGWANPRGGDGGFCAVANGRTSYYFSSQFGTIYRYLLNGSGAITGFTRVDPTGGAGYAFVTPFLLDPNNDAMMYLAAGGTVWRNSNLTAIPLSSNSTTSVNWTKMTNTGTGGGTVSALAVSTSPANRLYYGRSTGSVYRIDGADAGDPVPADITGAGFPAGAYVSCLAVDPADAGRVIAVFSNYNVQSLFFTSDGGASWAQVSGNLEQFPDGSGNGPSCRWAVILPGGGYFVGTSTGLYSTSVLRGSATAWVREGGEAIGALVVDMVASRTSDGLLAAGTHGGGAFTANVSLGVPPAPILESPTGVNLPLSVTFVWQPAPLATSYRLELATDSAFTSVVAGDTAILDTAVDVGGLLNKTKYFWRVAGKNALGWGAFASAGTFTTIVDTPGMPAGISPADGAVHLPVDALFVWNRTPDAETYDLEVTTDSSFGVIDVHYGDLADTFKVMPGLATGSRYFWRLRANNIGGSGPYSAVRSFTTVLAPPALLSPAPAAPYEQLVPDFRWHRVHGATAYRLEVSTTPFFTTTVHHDSMLVDTTGVSGALNPAAMYYWRVTARDPVSDGPPSETRSFLTIGAPPGTPALISPPDGATEVSVVAPLRWSASAGTRSYHLQVDTGGTFAAPLLDDAAVNDTVRPPGVLAKRTTYFWRVMAQNDLGSSPWTPASEFQTINEVQVMVPMAQGWNMRSVPLVLADYRRTTVYPGSTAAYAYAGSYQAAETLRVGRGYWIRAQESGNLTFLGTPVEQESVSVSGGWNLIGSVGEPFAAGGVIEMPAGTIASNFFGYNLGYVIADTLRPAEAYWVKAAQAGTLVIGTAPASEPRARRPALPPLPEQLTFMAAGGERQTLRFGRDEAGRMAVGELPPPAPERVFDVRFGTNARAGALHWTVPIAVSGAEYPLTVRWEVTDAGFSLLVDGREVRLHGEGSMVLAAPPAGIGLSAGRGIPEDIVLDQNFPNPFNPSTEIGYGVPRPGMVRLVVYDLLGREAGRLVDAWREAGFYTESFNAAGLSAGLYYYRLSANGLSQTRKLLLLK